MTRVFMMDDTHIVEVDSEDHGGNWESIGMELANKMNVVKRQEEIFSPYGVLISTAQLKTMLGMAANTEENKALQYAATRFLRGA